MLAEHKNKHASRYVKVKTTRKSLDWYITIACTCLNEPDDWLSDSWTPTMHGFTTKERPWWLGSILSHLLDNSEELKVAMALISLWCVSICFPSISSGWILQWGHIGIVFVLLKSLVHAPRFFVWTLFFRVKQNLISIKLDSRQNFPSSQPFIVDIISPMFELQMRQLQCLNCVAQKDLHLWYSSLSLETKGSSGHGNKVKISKIASQDNLLYSGILYSMHFGDNIILLYSSNYNFHKSKLSLMLATLVTIGGWFP